MIHVENKYELGQTVYYLDKQHHIRQSRVCCISVLRTLSHTEVFCMVEKEHTMVDERELFATLGDIQEHYKNKLLNFV